MFGEKEAVAWENSHEEMGIIWKDKYVWINVSDQFKVICQFSVIFNLFCKMTLRVTKATLKCFVQ